MLLGPQSSFCQRDILGPRRHIKRVLYADRQRHPLRRDRAFRQRQYRWIFVCNKSAVIRDCWLSV